MVFNNKRETKLSASIVLNLQFKLLQFLSRKVTEISEQTKYSFHQFQSCPTTVPPKVHTALIPKHFQIPQVKTACLGRYVSVFPDLLKCACQLLSSVQLFVTPWTTLTKLLCPWKFPGKNIAVDSHFPLERIFLTHRSKPGLLHCRQILYHLSNQGGP